MTPEAFVYWLQGFFELTDSKRLTEAQVKMIKEHLQTVFTKVTPPLSLPASPHPVDYIRPPVEWNPFPSDKLKVIC